MTVNEILNRLVEKEHGAQIYVGDHYSIKQLITDLEELRDEEIDNDSPDDGYTIDPERLLNIRAQYLREFCASCGAGVGEHRRPGEGTCQLCDPEGVIENAGRNAWIDSKIG